jgi:hypothetical protein
MINVMRLSLRSLLSNSDDEDRTIFYAIRKELKSRYLV